MLIRVILPAFMLAIFAQTADAQVMSGGKSIHERVNREALNQIRDKKNKHERKILDDKVTEVDERVEATNAEIERMKNEVTAKDNAIDLLTRRMVLLCRKMGLTGAECNMTNPVTNQNVTAENSFCYASPKGGNYRKGQWFTAKFKPTTGTLEQGYKLTDNFEIPVGASKQVRFTMHNSTAGYNHTTNYNTTCTSSARLNVRPNGSNAALLGGKTGCYKGSKKISCNVGKWSSKDRSSNRSNDGSPSCDADTGAYCVKGSKCYAGRTKIRCGYKKCPRAVYRYCR